MRQCGPEDVLDINQPSEGLDMTPSSVKYECPSTGNVTPLMGLTVYE